MGARVVGLIAIVDRGTMGSQERFVARVRHLCARLDATPQLWVRARCTSVRPPEGLEPHPRLIVPQAWATALGGAVAAHRRAAELGALGGGPGGGASSPSGGGGLGERGAAAAPALPGLDDPDRLRPGPSDPPRRPGRPSTFASVHDGDEAALALATGADALLLAPIFAPRSKPGQGRGLALLAEIAAATGAPVFALGGITPDRVAACLGVGAAGVAVLSPVSRPDRGPDPAIDALLEALSA